MQDFEEKIKPYVTKIVDEDNPQIVKYKPAFRMRTIGINLKDPKKSKMIPRELPPGCTKTPGLQGEQKKVKTPDGLFNTTREAAVFYGISPATVTYRCVHWTEHDFFYYVGDK